MTSTRHPVVPPYTYFRLLQTRRIPSETPPHPFQSRFRNTPRAATAFDLDALGQLDALRRISLVRQDADQLEHRHRERSPSAPQLHIANFAVADDPCAAAATRRHVPAAATVAARPPSPHSPIRALARPSRASQLPPTSAFTVVYVGHGI